MFLNEALSNKSFTCCISELSGNLHVLKYKKKKIKVFISAVLCKLGCIYSERDMVAYIYFIPRVVFWLLDVNEDNGKNMGKVNCKR